MRNILRASVLVFVLACPVFAGEIPCPVVEPTPQPAPAMQEALVVGEIQSPQTPDSSAQDGRVAAVTFFEVVLNLLALL